MVKAPVEKAMYASSGWISVNAHVRPSREPPLLFRTAFMNRPGLAHWGLIGMSLNPVNGTDDPQKQEFGSSGPSRPGANCIVTLLNLQRGSKAGRG